MSIVMATSKKCSVKGISVKGEISFKPTSSVNFGYGALSGITTGNTNTAVGYYTLSYSTTASCNVAIGATALDTVTTGNLNTCIGNNAGYMTTAGAGNVAAGMVSFYWNTLGNYNTAVGYYANAYSTISSYNVAVGYYAMVYMPTPSDNFNTAVGYNACSIFPSASSATTYSVTVTGGTSNNTMGLATGTSTWFLCTVGTGYFVASNWYMFYNDNGTVKIGNAAININGTGTFKPCTNTGITNSTSIGYNSVVTASNQVQLGNSSTSTYAYGAVQNRSDERDKTEIRDTVLGLDFIKALRPVDYKWNYREDYKVEEHDAEGNVVSVQYANNDGSKTRTRFHHGLIAQEVKAILDELGIDFGGYQDQLLTSDSDVKTIGYQELIAPLIKAIQELHAENNEIEQRVLILENK